GGLGRPCRQPAGNPRGIGPHYRPAATEAVGDEFRFISHALTHIGLVRQGNEDAFLERPDLGPGMGLWAVADGMGGHEAGDFASASIVTALGAIEPLADLGDVVEAAAAELGAVDAALRARAAQLGPAAVIASTVVVLLANADEFACLWAGDSRLYR